MIKIVPLKRLGENDANDIQELMRQLSSDPKKATRATRRRIREVVAHKTVAMFVARDKNRIIGMATLIVLPKLSGDDASIEDVVVNESHRGMGLGSKLTRRLIEEAKKRKVITLSLTSRPSRVAANGMYKKLGFRLKETNFYQMPLKR